MIATGLIVLPCSRSSLRDGWRGALALSGSRPRRSSPLRRLPCAACAPVHIVAHARWADLWRPGFHRGVRPRLRRRLHGDGRNSPRGARPLPDAAIDGLNAAYPNAGFLGFPLALVALGQDAMAPSLIATIVTVCVISARPSSSSRLVCSGRRGGCGSCDRSAHRCCATLCSSRRRSACSSRSRDGASPAPVETFLILLSGAASPCALVALGLFLGSRGRAASAPTVRRRCLQSEARRRIPPSRGGSRWRSACRPCSRIRPC